MSDNTETKWEYIARRYSEAGDTTKARVAEKIQQCMDEIPEYTNRTTTEWDNDIVSGFVDNSELIDVIGCTDYCVACDYQDGCDRFSCDDCAFRAAGGTTLFRELVRLEKIAIRATLNRELKYIQSDLCELLDTIMVAKERIIELHVRRDNVRAKLLQE